MRGRVQGQVAFVTGGARGQGRSHCVRLAQEGADVVVVDLCADIREVPYRLGTRAELDETVRLVEQAGGRALPVVADVRSREQLDAAASAAMATFGRLDIVVANAGINVPSDGPVTEQAWRTVVDINLTGLWRTARVTVPHIIAGGRGGSVVLTSSAAGLRAYEGIAHYTAAKHAVNGLMKTMAQELAGHRIRVNSLNPTQVDTPMIMNEPMYRVFCPDLTNPTREDFAPVSQAMNALPVPWVDPVDVSEAMLFLVSEQGRHLTGVALPVDAGVLVT